MTWYHSLLGLAALLLACDSQNRGPIQVDPRVPTPEVEYSGCWAVYLPGPVCAFDPASRSRLTLWVKTRPGTDVEIRAGGQRLADDAKPAPDDGQRFHLQLPSQSSSITVRLRQQDGTHSSAWSLALKPTKIPDWWIEAQTLATHGKTKEMEPWLEKKLPLVPPKEQGLVLWLLAVLASSDGRENQAAAYLEQGIQVDRREGFLTGSGRGEVEKVGFLVSIYLKQARFAEARRILSDLNISPEAPADAQYLEAYRQGLLAEKVGNYRSALAQLRKAVGLARRGGMDSYRWAANQVLARVLQELGRSGEAAKVFAVLPLTDGDPCGQGTLLTNKAWSLLLAHEGGEEVDDPIPMLKRAQALFDNKDCARQDQRLNARLNLALAYQQAQRWPEARNALAEAPSLISQANLDQRLWWLDLKGRQEINANNPATALQSYEELERLAEQALSLEGRFRAAVGRAKAQLALGRRPEAITALAEADPLIERQTWQIPAQEGRDTFIAQRKEATALLLRLLLDDEQWQRALDLVRKDRSRLLRQLALRDRLAQLTPEEQQRWDRSLSSYWSLRDKVNGEAAKERNLPADQLQRSQKSRASQLAQARQDLDRAIADLGNLAEPGNRQESRPLPPGPGEVILTYHPVSKNHWAAFAAYSGGVQAAEFDLPVAPLPDTQALARSLIEPFKSVLAQARRVRVLPYGPLRSVDFHDLPLNGQPLLASLPVVYSLDLEASPSPTLPGRPVALLVTDPEGNLPAARKESDEIAKLIGTWSPGWSSKRLDGTAANAESVRKALSGADLFQFAGHGELAGFAGWDSALLLADGSRLTPGDLLALRRVPAWVVLSTCEGGRSSEVAPGEGIGLAQAFLLAGSRAVVASIRPVHDTIARDFMIELYKYWKPGLDLAQPFRQAQLALRQRHPEADWKSFRLLEP
jgi:cellulose synthase operon protein C